MKAIRAILSGMDPETAARQRNQQLIDEGYDIPSGAAFVAPDGSVQQGGAPQNLALPGGADTPRQDGIPEPNAGPRMASRLPQDRPVMPADFADQIKTAGPQPGNLGLNQITPEQNPSELHLSATPPTPAPSDAPEKAAIFYDQSLLNLAHEEGEDGLIYKPICKTGTLALSPGPGQTDSEVPLELTDELFDQLVMSVEERAFPYVTIPQTHENQMMENTGYIRSLVKRPSTDPTDPEGTNVLWAGHQFTEPDVKEKVLRGTIPDTSIGVKFNYRNKRSGKLYPAALEHVALTHQPWVDGLDSFGQDVMLSIAGAEKAPKEEDFLGVFMSQASAPAEKPKERSKPRSFKQRTSQSVDKSRRGDILPERSRAGGLPDTLKASQQQGQGKMKPEQKGKATVEKLLASQQAKIEAQTAKIEEQAQALSLTQGTAASTATALHLSQVDTKVAEWQKDGVTPAVASFAKECLLAIGPEAEATEETAVMNLSIASTDEAGETTVEQKPLSLSQVIETFVAKSPKIGGGDIRSIMAAQDDLALSQQPGKDDTKSDAEKGKAVYEEAKKTVEGGVS